MGEWKSVEVKVSLLMGGSLSSVEQGCVLVELAMCVEQAYGDDETTGLIVGTICHMLDGQLLSAEAEATAFFALGKCQSPVHALQAIQCVIAVAPRIQDPFSARSLLILLENYFCIDALAQVLHGQTGLTGLGRTLSGSSNVWRADAKLYQRVQVYLAMTDSAGGDALAPLAN